MATSSKWLGHQPVTLAMLGSSPDAITILEVSMINGKRLEHGINEIFQQYEFENYKDALKYCQSVYQNNADPLEVEKIVKKYIQ